MKIKIQGQCVLILEKIVFQVGFFEIVSHIIKCTG